MSIVSTQVNQHQSLTSDLRARALKIFTEKLTGKKVSDLEESAELREFTKEYQEKWGFHVHLKNGNELDPCDGLHGQEASTANLPTPNLTEMK